jgi:glucose dehydrogenase
MIERSPIRFLVLALTTILCGASAVSAQLTGLENGEWHYLGGDAGHTRSAPQLNQINASNFADLQVAWIYRGDNFGPGVEYTIRSTPVFADGVLYTVLGQRRQVVAIDPTTGETLWVFREPETMRYLRSPRSDFGKGVAYAEVDGRGVIYITSPAWFLWALDAKTGLPLDSWGERVPVEDFSPTGVIDLIPDLVGDWGPWQEFIADRGVYDPAHGIPRQLGMVTSSSPPIVVNGVVVVLVGHEPSYDQTRIENVPGDIMGYDARTGEHLWKFHVIPRPGEFGHETWENDAWRRPGDNLFGGSVIALDVQTGERRWHYQIHHSDQWNYDIPTAPILMDLTVDGERIPALIQNTKQGLIFAFNRETGEPIWPIEERPVMQTQVPGNYTSPTQPYPTRPEPLDRIVTDGITEEFVIDYTPDLYAQAKIILSQFRVGGLYMPPLPYPHNNEYRNVIGCMGGLNTYHPPIADPTTGIMYASHNRGCNAPGFMVPTNGEDEERGLPGLSAESWRGRERHTPTTGTTVAAYAPGGAREPLPLIEGLPLYKPLYQALAAYDMNTGEKLWDIPIGETREGIRNHPLLEGVEINAGGTGFSIQMVVGDLLLQTTEDLRGNTEVNENGMPLLHARDKRTGEILASVELPRPGQYGMMTYMHEGRQYIVMQSGSAKRDQPGGLMALTLP